MSRAAQPSSLLPIQPSSLLFSIQPSSLLPIQRPPFCPLPADLCTTHRPKSVPSACRCCLLSIRSTQKPSLCPISLSGQSDIWVALWKWVACDRPRCQELIPVNQERQPACSWLDTLIPSWRTARPSLLINNHPPTLLLLFFVQTFFQKPSPVR